MSNNIPSTPSCYSCNHAHRAKDTVRDTQHRLKWRTGDLICNAFIPERIETIESICGECDSFMAVYNYAG